MTPQTIFLACLVCAACQAGKVVEIKDANEFILWALSAFDKKEPVTDTVKLLKDLTFDAATTNVAPLGETYNTPFSGTLDGNGHTIHNLVVDKYDQSVNVGLFTKLKDATIKHITFAKTCNFTAADQMTVGTIAAVTEGTIVFNDVISEANVQGMNCAGGFIGEVQSGIVKISNCQSKGKVCVANKITYDSSFGGFIGNIRGGDVTFKSCSFSGVVNQSAIEDIPPESDSNVVAVYEQMAAGFVGGFMGSHGERTVSLIDCESAGMVLSIDETNGFASTGVTTVENCLFSGKLQRTGYHGMIATYAQKVVNLVVTGTAQRVDRCALFRQVEYGTTPFTTSVPLAVLGGLGQGKISYDLKSCE